MKLGAMVAVSSFALSQVAAGQAVQWKVSEGGNGHWYRIDPQSRDWSAAQQLAVQQGGHLATLTTPAEDQAVRQALPLSSGYHWLGGFQYPSSCEPSCDWRWVTGERWSFSNWRQGEPNAASGEEDYLESVPTGGWNDRDEGLRPSVMEWSADCNNDGIVDYGQCRDGSLPDYNGNNIPDCCEQGVPCVVGNYPMQWRIEEGGNGHWYQLFSRVNGRNWDGWVVETESRGGHLVTLNSAAERDFVSSPRLFGSTAPSCVGGHALIGLFQPNGSAEPAGGWQWVTGEPFTFDQGWWGSLEDCCPGSPYCAGQGEDAAAIWSWAGDCVSGASFAGKLNDVGKCLDWWGAIAEWSADCNNDGIVDYGQILLGQLADVDANGVPDLCEAYEVPGEFSTIQAAIDAVPAGQYGLVRVAAGTRNESFSLNGKNVRVQGAPNNATILDGTGLTTSIARFTGGEPATAGLAGLVFRNGSVGSRIYPKATFTVGGAVYGLNSAALITNCRFEQNEADFGGAVYLLRSDSAVEACVFAGNEALTDGGAFFAYECAGFVRGCDFAANSCGASGSGNGGAFKTVGAKVAGGTFLLQDCSITGTISGVDGAAVQHFENSSIGVRGNLRIVDTDISANSTSIGAGGVRNEGPQLALILAGTTSVCGNAPRNVGGPFLIEGTASVCGCLADVTGDGQVNGGDLGIVLSSWGGADALGSGDVNHDGVIDGSDLSIVLSNWGACGN